MRLAAGVIAATLLLISGEITFAQATSAKSAPPHMIVASHPDASAAGLAMLERGGSAIDAAIAAVVVMGLVEPQSSGLGGGAFVLHWDPHTKLIESYDGRETSPQAATPDLFLDSQGQPLDFMTAVVGGKSVGVPGLVAVLARAHHDHGKLPWATLFAPAETLAHEGFVVSPRLAKAIAQFQTLKSIPESADYFYPGGEPLKAGGVVRNPDYAKTIRLIAQGGPKAFYRGALAQAIVRAVQTSPTHQGQLTMDDMARYRAVKRAAMCGPYRDHRICSMGPPSSGAVTMLQILGILSTFDMKRLEPQSLAAVHHFAEASRLAFADRDFYLGDPDQVQAPLRQLLTPQYHRARARLINPRKAMAKPLPGYVLGEAPSHTDPAKALSRPSTAHLSVIDGQGRAVALTATVEGGFGSHLMAGGFVLNNQLTDFVFRPVTDGRANPNAPGGNKRPLSSMTPAFVFAPDGTLKAVIGSPGGWRIILYVTQSIAAMIDWDMAIEDAIRLTHVTGRGAGIEVEAGEVGDDLIARLTAMGHTVKTPEMASGLNGIKVTRTGLTGGADPRREGLVLPR